MNKHYRVDFYDNTNPYTPYDTLYVSQTELRELIDYYKGLYDNYSKRKTCSTLYYDFWGNYDTDSLYLVVQEL